MINTYTTNGTTLATYGKALTDMPALRLELTLATQEEERTYASWKDAQINAGIIVQSVRFNEWLDASKAHSAAIDRLYEGLAGAFVS